MLNRKAQFFQCGCLTLICRILNTEELLYSSGPIKTPPTNFESTLFFCNLQLKHFALGKHELIPQKNKKELSEENKFKATEQQ